MTGTPMTTGALRGRTVAVDGSPRSSSARRAGAGSDLSWTDVPKCPACGSDDDRLRSRLPDDHYSFAGERVALPDGGVSVIRCGWCGLHYKTPLPAPTALVSLLERHAGEKWMEYHDYASEASVVRELARTTAVDLIDIGCAGGGLLSGIADDGFIGRRAGLDVVRYPGIERHLDGEFISGLLDDPVLNWSGEAYDVATAFDVLEHVYDPVTAFANLRGLVKRGGLVVIETGNSESEWPQRYGAHNWWYARLIEHHVLWSREALVRAAAQQGFEVVIFREVRHKSRHDIGVAGFGIDLLKVGLYRAAPDAYMRLAARFGREGNQPWDPLAKDHLQTCLRKR